MSMPDEPRPPGSDNGDVHLEAHASDQARIHQAGRDQHFHYGERSNERRRTAPGAVVGECPYPGLATFGREQARWFFGRDELIAELIACLDERLLGGGIQMVVAPSGAGKSSLLRAGLLPRLSQGALPGSNRWPALVFTPTADPVQALTTQICSLVGADSAQVADQLAADPDRCAAMLRDALREQIGGEDPGMRVVVVADQLEELFTLCADERRRRMFIDLLTRLAGPREAGSTPPVGLVVAGLRADFYAACAGDAHLRAALQDSPLLVGAMSPAQVREAIVYPAQDVGLDIEPGLVELLLRDLGVMAGADGEETTGYEAGRLPFLAHTLRSSWQQRHGATLTVAGYQTTGGIQNAIATTADRVLASLEGAERRMARSVFLRLVKIGDGADDTRRRVPHAGLAEASGDPPMAAAVVDVFAQARLLTRRQDTVEITHEALLRGWPQLRRWIDGDRAGRLIHQDLEETATVWRRAGRDSARLYRGNQLTVAQEWAATAPPDDLSPVTRAFLAACTRQQHRTARLRAVVIAALTVLTVLAAIAAVIAFQQQGEAVLQRDLAVYNRVLAEADRVQSTDVTLAAQLTLIAHHLRPGDDTYTRLLSTQHTALSRPLSGHTDTVKAVAFSRYGRILASSGKDERVWLWDMTDSAHPKSRGWFFTDTDTDHINIVNAIALSPNGRTLATASNTVQLWDIADPSRPKSLGPPITDHGGTVSTVTFSRDGRILASGGDDRTVRLWNVSDPARPRRLGRPLRHPDSVIRPGRPLMTPDSIYSVAISPDGRTLASADVGGAIWLWNIATPAHPKRRARPLIYDGGSVLSVAFSSDGQSLAGAGLGGTILLWHMTDPAHPEPFDLPLTGHAGDVFAVTFSPDGHTLASASSDRTVRLWNISSPEPETVIQSLTGHTDAVNAVAFSPDGDILVSAGDKSVRSWDLPRSWLPGNLGQVSSVAFTPDGRTVASAGSDVLLWDVTHMADPKRVGHPLVYEGGVHQMALSPDGYTLASIDNGRKNGDDSLSTWDITDPTHPQPLSHPLNDRLSFAFWAVAFSPGGHILAEADEGGSVWLWDITDPAHPKRLGVVLTHSSRGLSSVAFSPSGRTLAVGGSDLYLWDITDPNHPKHLADLLDHDGIVNSVAFSPGGRTLASAGDDRSVRLWNLTDPARPQALSQPLLGHTGPVNAVSFNSNGRTMASGGGTSVRLWNLADPAHPQPLGEPIPGHTQVYAVAFSRDGHTLASAGSDASVRLWNLNVDAAIQRICAFTKNVFTPKEWHSYVGDEVPYTEPCD